MKFTTRILVGHVLDRLRELPDEVGTLRSDEPPYWGLRDYAVEPQVWGGADSISCTHRWGDVERTAWANSIPGPAARDGGSRINNVGGFFYQAEIV